MKVVGNIGGNQFLTCSELRIGLIRYEEIALLISVGMKGATRAAAAGAIMPSPAIRDTRTQRRRLKRNSFRKVAETESFLNMDSFFHPAWGKAGVASSGSGAQPFRRVTCSAARWVSTRAVSDGASRQWRG